MENQNETKYLLVASTERVEQEKIVEEVELKSNQQGKINFSEPFSLDGRYIGLKIHINGDSFAYNNVHNAKISLNDKRVKIINLHPNFEQIYHDIERYLKTSYDSMNRILDISNITGKNVTTVRVNFNYPEYAESFYYCCFLYFSFQNHPQPIKLIHQNNYLKSQGFDFFYKCQFDPYCQVLQQDLY